MTNDPGLAGDTCFYMEAVSGDGGTHDPAGTWWLSPDIQLTGPVSGPDNADPGQTNPVVVKFHRKSANTDCNTPGDESITVQLWVGNPSLAMAPDNQASTFMIANIGSPMPAPGATGTQQVDWSVPSGLPPDNPQGSGHKCLIARCFPDSLSPSNSNFFLPDDPHLAQHNICIVPCPEKKLSHHQLHFKVSTLNPGREKRARLRAVLDLKPREFVGRTVLTRLKKVHGFNQLATAAPTHGFKFDLAAISPSNVHDNSQGGPHPNFEAEVTLTNHVVHLDFIADLTGTQAGDAFIYHLTQTDTAGHPQGGLTLVLVKL
ncbi:MAG TPA: hypothetical protein DC054_00475 [Blastocatellia bacterium]|nr:hypothetical protein [Blastocatellia bacterium]